MAIPHASPRWSNRPAKSPREALEPFDNSRPSAEYHHVVSLAQTFGATCRFHLLLNFGRSAKY